MKTKVSEVGGQGYPKLRASLQTRILELKASKANQRFASLDIISESCVQDYLGFEAKFEGKGEQAEVCVQGYPRFQSMDIRWGPPNVKFLNTKGHRKTKLQRMCYNINRRGGNRGQVSYAALPGDPS